MKAVDTHCHLSHTLKKGLKLNIILEHAEKNNVVAMIDSPVYVDGYIQSIRFHRRFPRKIFVTLGASPANYHEMNINKTIYSIREFAEQNEIVGIGEVGLDYYWVKNQAIRKSQHETFKQFIELANELNLPLVIHSRNAEKEAVKELLKAEVKVVMHSFAGDSELAKECVDRGYFISIPTSVTTRKKNRILAEHVPVEHLVTETDSPYLSPFPEKKRNEPANVIYAVKEIAKIKNINEDEVASIIYDNILNIYNLNL